MNFLMESKIFEIFLYFIACIFGSITLFFRKYNKKSDKKEKETNNSYSIKKFFKNNFTNFIVHIITGVFIFIFICEYGINFLVNFFGINLEKDTITISIAYFSGLCGYLIIELILEKLDRV